MLISEILALFSRLLSVVSTIFMIWMLIDCARNQSIKNKGAWIVFILFTQLIGSIVYFFARGPWPKVKSILFSQRSFLGYLTVSVPQSMLKETFSAYECGYQAQQQTPMPTLQEKNMQTEEIKNPGLSYAIGWPSSVVNGRLSP